MKSRITWARHVERMEEKKKMACWLLVGKPEGKRAQGRPRRRWVNSIKMDPAALRWGSVDWIGLTQYRGKWEALVSAAIKLWVQ
jgi:hypothetical protein